MGKHNCSYCKRSAEDARSLINACNVVGCPGLEESMVQVEPDPTNPTHYKQGEIECIEAIKAATIELTGEEAYCTGCAIKYLWRWKRKGGHEDLRKARWYINRIIGD